MSDGGQAFPSATGGGEFGLRPVAGMTLRDYFAGQSLANLYTHSEMNPDKVAEWAYQVADAMLSARCEGQE